jgi:serine/threonine-protein kinase
MRYCSQCHASYGTDERFCPNDGAAIVDEAAADHPLVGRTLGGRYLIRRRIGKGGMGEVFEADHIGLDKRVAIKFLLEKLNTDREVLTRFHREARTASKIGHENIVDITDIGETEQGEAYIVMELLTGQDLGQVLHHTGPMNLHRATNIIKQICRGLSAAHASRSWTSGSRRSSTRTTRRCDSRRPARSWARPSTWRRSRRWQAKTSTTGPTCTRSASCSTSCCAAARRSRATATCTWSPPPRSLRSDIPPAIETLLLRALEKEPSKRPETMRAFEKALPPVPLLTPSMVERPQPLATKSSMPPGAYAAPTAMPARKLERTMKPLLLVGAAALAAGGMIAFGYFSRGDDRAATAPATAVATTPAPPTDAGSAPVAERLAAAEQGTIEIDSVPQGAVVWFDGEEKGATPLELTEVAPGVHLIRLELAKHAPLEAQKRVRAGYSETFFGALAPARSGRKSRVRTGRKARRDKQPTPDVIDPEPVKPDRSPPAADPDKPRSPPRDKDRKPNPFDKDRKPNPFAD